MIQCKNSSRLYMRHGSPAVALLPVTRWVHLLIYDQKGVTAETEDWEKAVSATV